MTTIVQEETERFRAAGILRSQNGQACTSAPTETDNSDEENCFFLKLWHDHSDILNSSYVNFMVSFLYNTKNFLTDEEYKEKFPENLPMDVQSFVERPKLYIFGKSGMYIFKHSSIWSQGKCILRKLLKGLKCLTALSIYAFINKYCF